MHAMRRPLHVEHAAARIVRPQSIAAPMMLTAGLEQLVAAGRAPRARPGQGLEQQLVEVGGPGRGGARSRGRVRAPWSHVALRPVRSPGSAAKPARTRSEAAAAARNLLTRRGWL